MCVSRAGSFLRAEPHIGESPLRVHPCCFPETRLMFLHPRGTPSTRQVGPVVGLSEFVPPPEEVPLVSRPFPFGLKVGKQALFSADRAGAAGGLFCLLRGRLPRHVSWLPHRQWFSAPPFARASQSFRRALFLPLCSPDRSCCLCPTPRQQRPCGPFAPRCGVTFLRNLVVFYSACRALSLQAFENEPFFGPAVFYLAILPVIPSRTLTS